MRKLIIIAFFVIIISIPLFCFAQESYDIFTECGIYIDSNNVLHTDAFEMNGIKRIYCSEDSHFAVDLNGSVYAWGRNEYGRLGIENSDDQFVNEPVLVEGISNIKSVCTIQGITACNIFLTEDGLVYMAGLYVLNLEKLLGDDDPTGDYYLAIANDNIQNYLELSDYILFSYPYPLEMNVSVLQIQNNVFNWHRLLKSDILILMNDGTVAELNIGTMHLEYERITNIVELSGCANFYLAKDSKGKYYGRGCMTKENGSSFFAENWVEITGTDEVFSFSSNISYIITTDGVVWQRIFGWNTNRRIVYNVVDAIKIKGSYILTTDGSIYKMEDQNLFDGTVQETNEAKYFTSTGWSFDVLFNPIVKSHKGSIWEVGGFFQ